MIKAKKELGQNFLIDEVALNKIITGLRWRQVLPPLILKGSWQEDYLKQLEKFVLAFASGVELGIY